jgi:TatD DNase family protein
MNNTTVEYFDTHAHYDDAQFDEERDALLASLPSNGVSLVVNPGCDIASSYTARNLAEKYEFIYFAAGIHPEYAKSASPDTYADLYKLLKHDKSVALGEIGLDYYYPDPPRELQRKALREQLAIARELNKPVILHDREAHADSLAIVKEFMPLRMVFHCYSGSWEFAKELLRLGAYISFTGSVTFKNAIKVQETAAKLPADRLMIETDSPYLAPTPLRGKRNDSTNLVHICEKISELRGLTHAEAARLTMRNGVDFFGI